MSEEWPRDKLLFSKMVVVGLREGDPAQVTGRRGCREGASASGPSPLSFCCLEDRCNAWRWSNCLATMKKKSQRVRLSELNMEGARVSNGSASSVLLCEKIKPYLVEDCDSYYLDLNTLLTDTDADSSLTHKCICV